MNNSSSPPNDLSQRIVKQNYRCFYWTFAWTLSMALATFGPKFFWDFHLGLTIPAILLNLGLGIGMILAYKAWLNELDELQKKIQFDALALALGLGVVIGLSYSLLDITNVISFDAEIGHLVMAVSLIYLGGLGVGNLRYR